MIRFIEIISITGVFFICCFLSPPTNGSEKPEKYYQESWCAKHKGHSEYRLLDNARVDCLTDEYAVEFDFAGKWAEALGQSMHYSRMTGRKGAVVLICGSKNDNKKAKKLDRLINYYRLPIKLFIMKKE